MTPTYDDVLNNLKILLEKSGFKQNYVAKQIGLTDRELSDILYKRKLLRIEHIVPITEVLNVSPNDLFKTNEL